MAEISGVNPPVLNDTDYVDKVYDSITAIDGHDHTTGNGAPLTDVTLTRPVIDIESLTDQGSTPATPASGTTKIYTKTDGKLYKLTSAGVEQQVGTGNAVGISYITNSDFETATTGYAAYADAAGAVPVDGTGGSPVTTITRTTSSPLRGVASGLITKDAANRQGEGVSYAFTIDTADQAKPMSISFNYNIASGTFTGGTDSTTGDVNVYIYDVTNSQVIQPSSFKVLGSVSGQQYKQICEFQTNSNSTSYRLIWHIASTSASAWTFKFDNVQVGPTLVSFGAPVDDWATDSSFTPSAGFGTVTLKSVQRKRVGDSLHVVGYWKLGTAAASAGSLSLPAGLSIDSAKLSSATDVVRVGTWTRIVTSGSLEAVSSANDEGPIYYKPSSLGSVFISRDVQSNAYVANNVSSLFASSDGISVKFDVPILGWSSNVVMSQDTSSRIVDFSAYLNAGAYTANTTITGWTVEKDSHSSYSAGSYTVPVPGDYLVTFTIQVGASLGTPFIRKNGTTVSTGTGSSSACVAIGFLQGLRSGDIITVTNDVSSTSSSNTTGTRWSIQRISGPESILASELVSVRYTNTSGQAISASAAEATITNWTLSKDTHSAFNATSGVFTAPAPGEYFVGALLTFATNLAWSANSFAYCVLYKNGSVYSYGDIWTVQAAHTNTSAGPFVRYTDKIQMVAGDTLLIKVAQNEGTTRALRTLAGINYINIYRIGS